MATGGIAVCTLLVLVLLATLRGVASVVRIYAGQAGADLWVVAPGTDNLIRGSSVSLLPMAYRDSLGR